MKETVIGGRARLLVMLRLLALALPLGPAITARAAAESSITGGEALAGTGGPVGQPEGWSAARILRCQRTAFTDVA